MRELPTNFYIQIRPWPEVYHDDPADYSTELAEDLLEVYGIDADLLSQALNKHNSERRCYSIFRNASSIATGGNE
jgi:hypothetical protein